MRKKRVLKRNDYKVWRYGQNLECYYARMPSKAEIGNSFSSDGGVFIHYPCGTRRWISDTYYDDINTNCL